MLRSAETERVAGLVRDFPVAEVLRPYVERYWCVGWDLPPGRTYVADVLSHPCVNLSVESGTVPRFGTSLPSAVQHGAVRRRFTLELSGVGATTAVKFRPGGFTAMTGIRVRPDSVGPLDPALGLAPHAVVSDVLTAGDEAARVAALDAALAPLAGEPPTRYLDLVALLAEMLHDRSLLQVEQVADLAGVSPRSLQRLFAEYVGIGPKAVLARYRLQDAAALMDSGQGDDLAALAASLGWYDQGHFSRDFHDVVGTTPTAYLRRVRAGHPEVATSTEST